MRALKHLLISFFIRFLRHPAVQEELDKQSMLRHERLLPLGNSPAPYVDLKPGNSRRDISDRTEEASVRTGFEATTESPVFITSRFRSGSTLLWNIFRQIPRCTAYYEPFNERQWFDASLRGDGVDTTHRGVNDYWREYSGMEDLSKWYSEKWIREALYMDAQSWDPNMQRYLEALIHRAEGRPVLQFNRVDFRLGWLRHYFPTAPIVHLYRHPREQWLSFLTDKQSMSANTIESSYRDGFYLETWCTDLQKQFPFLHYEHTPHPYRRFYYLWKLSYVHGRHHAVASLKYEDLVSRPEHSLAYLLDAIDWRTPADIKQLASLIDAPRLDRWKDYASEDWFRAHEEHCETVLDDFFAAVSHVAGYSRHEHGKELNRETTQECSR